MKSETALTCRAALGLLVSLCIVAVYARSPAQETQDYKIGPRDVLKITVWGHDDLSKDYPVDPDGFVPFPLVGRTKASGLTTKEFAARLTGALEQDYLVNPHVMVAVKDYLSQKVQVLGEAANPGVFYLTRPTSLVEILSKAGGLSKTAGKQIVLVRPVRTASGSGTAQAGDTILRLDLARIESGDGKDNVLLGDEDTVFVPKAQAYFVLGEVPKPGAYSLDKATSALEAITVAGGFSPQASPAGVKILRHGQNGTQDTISLDLSDAGTKDRTFPVKDGDTVIVPKGNTIFVFGEVKRPGQYFLAPKFTILEAIGAAGGFTDFAALSRTRIIRKTTSGEQTIDVNMYDVIKRGQREKAVALQENDVVVVPQGLFHR